MSEIFTLSDELPNMSEEELCSWLRDGNLNKNAESQHTLLCKGNPNENAESQHTLKAKPPEKSEKELSRLSRNRNSAKASRARVKQRLANCAHLEQRCRRLEEELAKLNYFIHVLQQDNLKLKNLKK